MVQPSFLAFPEVQAWLDGIEPAWTLLDLASINRLLDEPDPERGALRVAMSVSAADLAASTVASNALALLRHAEATGGLKLTQTGNLARAVVAQLWDALSSPDYDKAETLRYFRVVNEPDFMPLHFTRIISQNGGLLRRYRGTLRLTNAGKQALTGAGRGALQTALFIGAFWRTNLDYFDRFNLDTWPQSDIAIVLWSLAVSASDWETAARLARMCASPIGMVGAPTWDLPAACFESRILRPLTRFGLLERDREETLVFGEERQRPRYRKTPAFDRLISFDIRLERPPATQH
jgi:hypothetical protein